MCPFGGDFVDGNGGSLSDAATLVCHVLVIETERDGLVLVDAGIGRKDIEERARLGGMFHTVARPTLDPNETAASRVEALGHSIDDVRHIVLTHLDLDHAGGIADFPDARVHVLAPEHAAALHPRDYHERARYRRLQFAHGPRFETYEPRGERWFGFESVRELAELDAEIYLIPTIGHSRGHTAVAVNDGARWLLHCGDAYFHRDEMKSEDWGCPPGLSLFQGIVASDRERMEDNKRRLRELKRAHGSEVTVFSAHDVRELERLAGAAH